MSARIIIHDRKWRGYNDGESVVTRCALCGPLVWQAINFSEDAARATGERHLEQVHGIAPGDAGKAQRAAAARSLANA